MSPSTTMGETGRRSRANIIRIVVILIVVWVVVALLTTLEGDRPVPGPDGSTFVTTSMGWAAFYELLDGGPGRSPIRLQRALEEGTLAAVDTYVVAESLHSDTHTSDEMRVLADFLDTGGTVVVVGTSNPDLVDTLSNGNIVAESGDPGPPVVSTGVVGRSGDLHLSGFGSLDTQPESVTTAAGTNAPFAAVTVVGDGTLHVLADPTPLANMYIDMGVNPWFATDMVDGVVAFDEYRLGFRESGDGFLGSLPGRSAEIITLLIPVIFVGLYVYGRRLGVPEPTGEPATPDRRLLIDSVTRSLRRTRDPVGATAPVRSTIQGRLGGATEPGTMASRDRLRMALTDEELTAVTDPRTTQDVLLADHVLARTTREDGRRRPT